MTKKLYLISTTILLLMACRSGANSQHQVLSQPSDKLVTTTGKFTPPEDKLLLFIGQDSDTISDYIKAIPEDNIEGVTLYSQLKHADPSKTLKAIFSPNAWQSGGMDFNKTLAQAPQAALAVGLAIDTCNQDDHQVNISKGKYDKTIAVMVEHFKSLAPRKVFLRIGYEFDGPWNCYSPEHYRSAFQTIAGAIKMRGADNIATVWQSAAWPDSYGNSIYDTGLANHLARWYPGDEFVDWISTSVFYRDLSQWNYPPPRTPDQGQQAILAFARSHKKPVMIAESAPQGYRIGQLSQSVIQENNPKAVTAEQIWQNWYQPYFDFIYSNNDIIRAVAYINTHWDTQAMWQCQPGIAAGQPGCQQGNWGDTRVQANELIKKRWLGEITDSKKWIQSGLY